MKTKYLIGGLVLASTALAGCDDFINDNRFPITSEVNSPTFWSSESNVIQECDRMKNFFDGYGYGGTTGSFYFSQLSDDQAGNAFRDWTFTNVPASGGYWTTGYTNLRHIMCIIDGVRSSQLDENLKKKYEGIARLMRAYTFTELVKRYGDVTWLEKTVQVSSTNVLYGPRTARDLVMDSVLRDLDYAVATIPAKSAKDDWSRDLALAIKSDVCLYEGTFCRYRTQAENGAAPDEARAKKFLQECANASKEIIDGGYTLSEDYRKAYNSVRDVALANPEIILTRAYDPVNSLHSTVSYTCSSTAVAGITKDAFDAFLFSDGLPKGLTSMDTSDLGEVDADGNYSIAKLLEVRDARLTAITDPIVYYKDMTWSRAGAMQMTSSTGYGVSKFDNVDLPVSARQNSAQNYTSCPLYYLSLIYCNYAEAKAELGTLTDADLNATLNKLYKRAKLPEQTVSGLSAIADPANKWGVSNLIWEVRRCRRCELMMDKDYRYWDLIRWHQLDKLDNTKYPDIALGANVKNAPVKPTLMSGDYFSTYFGRNRLYNSRNYLYPIPTEQLNLNENMKQNEGWKGL